MKNILVIGGSYFLGKAFVKLAISSGHDVTVFNRGNRPLNNSKIKELYGDRHDPDAMKPLAGQQFDAVVDFCGYEKNDILTVFQQLKSQMKQYVFISTCDVYERGTTNVQDEHSPFEKRDFGGEAGQYITGKVALEEELRECSAEFGIPYTSIRPAFIYGPENYAPREAMYLHWIEQAGQILHPTDATGVFQMVYVEDVAKAILKAIGNEAAFNEAFNLAPLPMITYESFADTLAMAVTTPFERVPVTVEMVNEKQIPLPFPLTPEESNRYDGEKVLQLIGNYTPLETGLKQTFSKATLL